jgi:hypothetical protein
MKAQMVEYASVVMHAVPLGQVMVAPQVSTHRLSSAHIRRPLVGTTQSVRALHVAVHAYPVTEFPPPVVRVPVTFKQVPGLAQS